MSLPSLFFRLNPLLPCVQFGFRLASLTPMRKGLQSLKRTGVNSWKTLLNTSRPICVNVLQTKISTLHETSGCKLLRSTWAVSGSSEPYRTRRGQPGRSCAPVFRQQKVSAPRRRAFFHRWSVNVCNKNWILSQRCGSNPIDMHKIWPPTCDQLSHVCETWHRLLQLGPQYAADPANWQQFHYSCLLY